MQENNKNIINLDAKLRNESKLGEELNIEQGGKKIGKKLGQMIFRLPQMKQAMGIV